MCDPLTALAAGGSLIQGMAGARAGAQQAAVLKSQARTEAQLNAVQDMRQRSQFASQISQQRAELAARGVTLDSVTAVALGRQAGQEMSFQSQATRSDGAARQIELTAAQRQARAEGFSSLLRGVTSAAGTVLQQSPDLWPGFAKISGGQT